MTMKLFDGLCESLFRVCACACERKRESVCVCVCEQKSESRCERERKRDQVRASASLYSNCFADVWLHADQKMKVFVSKTSL